MKIHSRRLAHITASAAFLGAMTIGLNMSSTAHAAQYSLTIIPNSSSANGINDSGTVVGSNDAAFSYNGGTTINIGANNSVGFSSADGINSGGTVVGQASNGTLAQAAIFTPSTTTFLGTGTYNSEAAAINSGGEIVGTTGNSTGGYNAAIFSATPGTSPIIIDTANSSARAINIGGTIVGYTSVSNSNATHAFSYTSSGGLIDLGTFGGVSGYANAINDSGVIVGDYTDSNGYAHAISDANGTITSLDSSQAYAMSVATAINNSGTIVGYAGAGPISGTLPIAFVYSNGVLSNLNSLVSGLPSGDSLVQANAINNNGDIVGFGNSGPDSSGFGFLLTPIPAGDAAPLPGSLPLLFTGTAGLALALLTANRRKVR